MVEDGLKRRRFPRYPTLISVRYYTSMGQFSGLVENLSSGGLFIATQRPLPPGTMLRMEISNPDTRQLIKLKGRVMWDRHVSISSTERRGMGIQFEDIGATERTRIEELIKKLSEKVKQTA